MANRPHYLNIILIAALAFIAYSNSFRSEFHFDDYSSIIAYPYIKSLHNVPYFFYYDGAPLTSRPVTMATFALNFAVGGLDPFSYHHVNFFIHLLNTILIYFLLLRLLENSVERYMDAAFYTSLMFAVHPIQTQAVTYIVQRAEILSALFYLLSIIIFRKAVETGRFRWVYLTGLFFTILLAAGSKEIAATIPPAILLYDFFFISDGNIKTLSKRWALHISLFLITFIFVGYFMGLAQMKYFASTEAVQPPPSSKIYDDTTSISRNEYFLTQFRVIWVYIKLLAAPFGQNLDYNFPVSKGLLKPVTTLIGGLGIIALFASAVFLFKRHRIVSFFMIWFFLILAPTSSVVPIPDVIFEHRVYLSSLGFFVIFTLGVLKTADIMFGKGKSHS